MSGSSELRQPAWTGVVLPLILAIGSTFSPEILRGILLAAAVIAVTWTFYLTKYGGRNFKKTALVGVGSIVLAFAIFAGGRILDGGTTKFAPIPPTIDQNAIDSDCSNVVAGGDAKINCPPTEKDHAPAKP
jgi:hypothetical protein